MEIHKNLSLKNLKGEIWKDIPDYEGYYQISSLGRVKGLDRLIKNGTQKINSSIRVQSNVDNRYLNVSLSKYGVVKTIEIHVLMAVTFLNHKRGRIDSLVVDHIDNNKLNNSLNNLQIVTNRYNTSKDKKGYSSKHTGVCFDKRKEKWLATIRISGRVVFLGLLNSEDDAGELYKCAVDNLNLFNGDRSKFRDLLHEISGVKRDEFKTTRAYYHTEANKWYSHIRLNGKSTFLGLYETEKEAYKSYEIADEIKGLYDGNNNNFRCLIRKRVKLWIQ